jgi:hypothetical protein
MRSAARNSRLADPAVLAFLLLAIAEVTFLSYPIGKKQGHRTAIDLNRAAA